MNFIKTNILFCIFLLSNFVHCSDQRLEEIIKDPKVITYTDNTTYKTMYTLYSNGNCDAITKYSSEKNDIITHYDAQTRKTHHTDTNQNDGSIIFPYVIID